MTSLLPLIASAIVATFSGYLINQLPALRSFPGRNIFTARVLAEFVTFGSILAALDDKQVAKEFGDWLKIGLNIFGAILAFDVCQFVWAVWKHSRRPSINRNLEKLVEKARQRVYQDIDRRCGYMRVLDMRQPIGLSAIYTDVNILKKITGKTRRDLPELMRGCTPENFDRFLLGAVKTERVEGLQVVHDHRQLMILGKPGAGKTTFLKRLATLCNRGEFLPEQVPIFITLKEFSETVNQPGCLNFIASFFAPDLSMAEVEHLLRQGRGLVLLDGLDEVLEVHHNWVLREIQEFARCYSETTIVITCRIAAREYVFEQFTEVEVADFSDAQIQDFADKWFKARQPEQLDADGTSAVGQLFWRALRERDAIKELASNPLLLTLLCLEFEESSEFPQSRVELYRRGLEVLLRKWDGQRRIQRDEIYKELLPERKESLLGQLAMQTFAQGEYFFSVEVAKQLIGQYIQNLPKTSTDSEALLVDSYAVLKSIEAQHGLLIERATDIYSFSHLTFHEYFTAKNILDSTDPSSQKAALEQLVKHMTEKRWREVFLLVTERMDSADYLLLSMKQRIDQMLASDPALQRFLAWVEEKSCAVEAPDKFTAIRFFYFNLDVARDLNVDLVGNLARGLVLVLEPDRDITRDLDFNIDHSVDILRTLKPDLDTGSSADIFLEFALGLIIPALNFARTRDRALDCAHVLDLMFDLALNRANNNPDFQHELKQLNDRLPTTDNWESCKTWWQANGKEWVEQLRAVMIKYRNIGHDWEFNDAQKQLLRQYYDANKLLVACLDSHCYLSRKVREEIEATLLLPISTIESLKHTRANESL